MIYRTRIKTGMIIDHNEEKVHLEELKIEVNGYRNNEVEKKAICSYNKNEEFSRYREVDNWSKRLWYNIFDDLYERLRYWHLVFRKKKKI